MLKNKVVLIGLLAFVLYGGSLWWTASVYGEGENSQGEKITYTIADSTGDWGYPSPYACYSRGPGYVRMSFIFDTLAWKDEKGFTPLLARSWEYDQEENAYTFFLRKGVTWHDGVDFTAEDVVFTFNYIKKHPISWVDSSIVEKTIEVDLYTVKVYLRESYAPFLSNIAGTLPILPKHIWQKIENPQDFREDEALIGTGPYRLLDYDKAQGSYLYQAYQNYYLGKPEIEKIRFIKISEQMASASLERGEVNASAVPPEIVDELKEKGFSIITSSGAWNAKLMFNYKKELLSSKEFRQALAYAINREEIVKITQRGYAVLGSPGLLPPSEEYWYNSHIEQYPYNSHKAKAILESLGYHIEDGYYGKDGQKLELELLTSPKFLRVAELISQQLEKIGITVDLRSLESKTLDMKVGSWKFDLAISGHGGLCGDPSILNKVILGKGFNSARYRKNETLNTLLVSQVHQMEKEKRRDIIWKIQEIYAEEIPTLTLYYPIWYWAHDGTINLYYTPGGLASGIPIPLNKLCFLGTSADSG